MVSMFYFSHTSWTSADSSPCYFEIHQNSSYPRNSSRFFCRELFQSDHIHAIIDYVAKFIKVPVVADVGVVVSLLNVLAVGEVTVVVVVVLSLTQTHRIRYFPQIIVQS